MDILFFTSATGFWENFVVPYVYFAERHNPGSKYEFIVDNRESFLAGNDRSLKWLSRTFGAEPVIRTKNTQGLRIKNDNTLRFIEQPSQTAAYIYIGDVDIIVLDGIMARHKPVFDAGLPYSNVVRKGTRRLTGLHLAKYDLHYPLPPFEDILDKTHSDEEILYRIVERKGLLYDDALYQSLGVGRPIHGLHVSMNRLPFSSGTGRVGWGLSFELASAFQAIAGTKEFEEFYATLAVGPSQILLNLLYLTRGIVDSGFEYYSSRVKKDGLYEKQETMLPAGPGDKAAVQPGSLQTVDPAASVEAQRIFTKIFERNSWGSMASVSGPSSTLLRTENLRSELPRIFTKYKVQKVFDAPCGDLNWMKEVLRVSDVSYLGADIVKPLIDKHIWDNAESRTTEFIHMDLVRSRHPKANLLISRDFLFHLSYSDTLLVLKNFLESKTNYILTTTHINNGKLENRDIKSGGWRWMDLFAYPYDFPADPLETIIDGGGDRYMCLWERRQILKSCARFASNLEAIKAGV